MKIFVSGASGNVGKTLVRTIQNIEWAELVGGWCKEAGQDLGEIAGIGKIGIIATDDLNAGLKASNPDIVIDFSATPVLPGNLKIYAEKIYCCLPSTLLNVCAPKRLHEQIEISIPN